MHGKGIESTTEEGMCPDSVHDSEEGHRARGEQTYTVMTERGAG